MKKFNNITNKYEYFDYQIGQIIKYKSYDKILYSLFLKNINDNEMIVVLIDTRLNEGIKVIINKSQIV
jgi:hypothetical protein